MRYGTLRKKALGRTCRRCINQKYRLNLDRRDCVYVKRPGICKNCRHSSHIVKGVRLLSLWRVWFKM